MRQCENYVSLFAFYLHTISKIHLRNPSNLSRKISYASTKQMYKFLYIGKYSHFAFKLKTSIIFMMTVVIETGNILHNK